MFRRISYFIILNFAIFITLQFVFVLIQQVWPSAGRYHFFVLMAVAFGMGGALISLQLSRWMAKKSMRIQLVNAQSSSSRHRWLYEKVADLSRVSKLKAIPEVGIYTSPEVNAFATGPSQRRSLVAVSEGLLHHMNEEEAEAVLAHEISHIKNGDMVTMALLQGVINTLVILASRVLAEVISNALRGRDSGGGGGFIQGTLVYFASYIVLNIIFSALGMVVLCFYSRAREYRADAGAAKLVGKGPMIKALEALQKLSTVDPVLNDKSLQTFKINSGKPRLMALFSTHPPLQNRIQALEMSHVD